MDHSASNRDIAEAAPDHRADDPVEVRLQRLTKLADAMDTKWRLFGVPIGWDTIIGLIPGIGDTLTSIISVYILREGHRLGVPWWVKLRMGWNIFLDWLIGLVPLLGDLMDIGWKANSKNVALIKRHARRDVG